MAKTQVTSKRGRVTGKRVIPLRALSETKRRLRQARLNSVCEQARCPNRGTCFAQGVATFLIGGDTCTRGCRFCSIQSGIPSSLDPDEPLRVAQAALRLQLRHVVVTAVNRDDLHDGGAGHFAATIAAIRRLNPEASVEVLVPDFLGVMAAVDTVAASAPEVFNHNVETVPRLYGRVRPGADYQRSLDVLARARRRLPQAWLKSGLMVGHGETLAELDAVFRDLYAVGVRVLTVGQYFQPTAAQLHVARVWQGPDYRRLVARARAHGFRHVWAGRYVRSSYMAGHVLDQLRQQQEAS